MTPKNRDKGGSTTEATENTGSGDSQIPFRTLCYLCVPVVPCRIQGTEPRGRVNGFRHLATATCKLRPRAQARPIFNLRSRVMPLLTLALLPLSSPRRGLG